MVLPLYCAVGGGSKPPPYNWDICVGGRVTIRPYGLFFLRLHAIYTFVFGPTLVLEHQSKDAHTR